MKKCIGDYEAYVVDFDGTLYFQRSLRVRMALHMMCYFITHPWKIKDMRIVMYYRHIREQGKHAAFEDFSEREYADVAGRYGVSLEQARRVINYWMLEVPLSYIKKEKDEALISFLMDRMSKGKKVIIYSDYPVKEKLPALNFCPSGCFYAGDAVINCLKPDNRGLEYILSELAGYGIAREDVLFIGDRVEKDGFCAEKSRIDYLILPSSKYRRRQQWGEEMFGK